MIARVLVRKNPQEPAGTKQLNWPIKSFASIEQLRAGANPSPADIAVDKTVSQALVGRPNPVRQVMRHQLGGQFPATDVAQNENHGPP